MTNKQIARAVALTAFLALPAAAGPLEDGQAAFEKGDYKTASALFAAAASQGNDTARAHLGTMFALGLGVPADPAQALFWLSLAAEHNNAEADMVLGRLYSEGKVFKQDWATAFKFYERAAQQGEPNSEAALGTAYIYGHGTSVDYDKAGSWLNRAAAQNNALAQYTLGFMFYSGLGVKQNYVASMQWFQKAADQGNAAAASFLAVQYDKGLGVPQSYELGVRYLTMASLQGNLQSLAFLGQKYLEGGEGVPADAVRGYVLLSIAAAQTGDVLEKTTAHARDNARAKLSAQELEAAQRLAAHCTSINNYVACLDSSRSVMVAANDPAPSEAAFAKAMQAHQQQAQAQTVARTGGAQMIGNGTGFFVSPDGDLVTAAHVANECPDMRIMDKHLKLVAKDTASDLALLSTGEKSPVFVKMRGGRGPVVGEPIVSIGFPLQGMLGEDRIVTTGVISSLAGLGNDRRDLQISAPIQPGNSGGPVLGQDGALLGVARSSISTLQAAQDIGGAVPQNANFAVSTGTLQSFLSAHNVDYVLANGSEPKKNSAEIASQASRFTVMVECWK